MLCIPMSRRFTNEKYYKKNYFNESPRGAAAQAQDISKFTWVNNHKKSHCIFNQQPSTSKKFVKAPDPLKYNATRITEYGNSLIKSPNSVKIVSKYKVSNVIDQNGKRLKLPNGELVKDLKVQKKKSTFSPAPNRYTFQRNNNTIDSGGSPDNKRRKIVKKYSIKTLPMVKHRAADFSVFQSIESQGRFCTKSAKQWMARYIYNFPGSHFKKKYAFVSAKFSGKVCNGVQI